MGAGRSRQSTRGSLPGHSGFPGGKQASGQNARSAPHQLLKMSRSKGSPPCPRSWWEVGGGVARRRTAAAPPGDSRCVQEEARIFILFPVHHFDLFFRSTERVAASTKASFLGGLLAPWSL